MALLVTAETPGDFRKWWAHQLTGPAGPKGHQMAGQEAFQSACGGCHAVRGTQAAGTLGPDLSHLMLRRTIASATLPNDSATLMHWIADPQDLKPGNRMPKLPLPQGQLLAIAAYLKTLD
jgi:cytochrome c oxidase subunit 2